MHATKLVISIKRLKLPKQTYQRWYDRSVH